MPQCCPNAERELSLRTVEGHAKGVGGVSPSAPTGACLPPQSGSGTPSSSSLPSSKRVRAGDFALPSSKPSARSPIPALSNLCAGPSSAGAPGASSAARHRLEHSGEFPHSRRRQRSLLLRHPSSRLALERAPGHGFLAPYKDASIRTHNEDRIARFSCRVKETRCSLPVGRPPLPADRCSFRHVQFDLHEVWPP